MIVHVYIVKGMGGAWGLFDAGMNFVRGELDKMPGVVDGGIFTYPQRDQIVALIRARRRANPASKIAIVGHSLGAVTACSVTDYVPVDLIALYDLAGAMPSRLGKNTGLALDFYDVAADIVPEWRPEAVRGYEKRANGEARIVRYQGRMGHVQCAFNQSWLRILKREIEILAQ